MRARARERERKREGGGESSNHATEDATGEHYEDQDEQGNAYVPTWIVKTNTQRCVFYE